jgi:hypothetical protein
VESYRAARPFTVRETRSVYDRETEVAVVSALHAEVIWGELFIEGLGRKEATGALR